MNVDTDTHDSIIREDIHIDEINDDMKRTIIEIYSISNFSTRINELRNGNVKNSEFI
jgi:hypothetical protein